MTDDIKLAKMEKDIEYIKKEQDATKVIIKETHKQLDSKLDNFIDSIDKRLSNHEEKTEKTIKSLGNRFASKYVEKGFWWVIISMVSAIAAAIYKLILK